MCQRPRLSWFGGRPTLDSGGRTPTGVWSWTVPRAEGSTSGCRTRLSSTPNRWEEELRQRSTQNTWVHLSRSTKRMREANILCIVLSKFADMDAHPDPVSSNRMGLIFEDLVGGPPIHGTRPRDCGHPVNDAVSDLPDGEMLFMEDDRLLVTLGAVCNSRYPSQPSSDGWLGGSTVVSRTIFPSLKTVTYPQVSMALLRAITAALRSAANAPSESKFGDCFEAVSFLCVIVLTDSPPLRVSENSPNCRTQPIRLQDREKWSRSCANQNEIGGALTILEHCGLPLGPCA